MAEGSDRYLATKSKSRPCQHQWVSVSERAFISPSVRRNVILNEGIVFETLRPSKNGFVEDSSRSLRLASRSVESSRLTSASSFSKSSLALRSWSSLSFACSSLACRARNSALGLETLPKSGFVCTRCWTLSRALPFAAPLNLVPDGDDTRSGVEEMVALDALRVSASNELKSHGRAGKLVRELSDYQAVLESHEADLEVRPPVLASHEVELSTKTDINAKFTVSRPGPDFGCPFADGASRVLFWRWPVLSAKLANELRRKIVQINPLLVVMQRLDDGTLSGHEISDRQRCRLLQRIRKYHYNRLKCTHMRTQVRARLRSEVANRRPSRIIQLMRGTSHPQRNQHPLAGSCRTLHCPVKVEAVRGAAVENLLMRREHGGS
ncbi:hypothetical protein KC325_g211 [Hortaea werneckii]|nr:hypothetical protein KC325_g211 [Hortaea werneckii]